jgi:hypothetical protein
MDVVFRSVGEIWHSMALLALALAVSGCGGSGNDPAPPPAAPSISAHPASLSVEAGRSATFTVSAAGEAPLSYQWLRNDAVVAGAIQSTYTLGTAALSDSLSRWSVRVSNPYGTVTSTEAVLTVTPPLGISLLVPKLGYTSDLAIDAQGNTLATVGGGTGLGIVARKFTPDGSEMPYGPDGRGLPLPGEMPNINRFGARYTGAAVSPSGDVYVSTVTLKDLSINTFAPDGGRLTKISPDGQVIVLADWPAGSDGAVAPASVTLGPDGSLYFADHISGHLMKRTSAGVVSSVADVQAVAGSFFGRSRYVWIAVDSEARAYVISSLPGSRVLKRVQGGLVTVVAGNAGDAGGADGIGSAASFESPGGLALGRDGTLYVADGARLRKVTPAGVVTTVAGKLGSEGTTTGPLPGSLGTLSAIAVASDRVLHVASQTPIGGELVRIQFD